MYPEKEKGDKVQEVVSFHWALEEAWQSLMNSRIKDIEEWQMSRRYWRGIFHLVCDRNYYKRMNGDEGGGGGGSSSGRTGTNQSGNGAWAVTNEWNKEYEKQYRDFSATQAEKYKAEGRKFTCEDLALQVLIDFASQNNLPVILATESGVFNASDGKWNGDIEGFTCALQAAFGSNDLLSSSNTVFTSMNNVSAGDLLIQVNELGIGHHTQIVESTTNSSINIIQGDATRQQAFGWSANPCSPWYSGGYMGYTITRGNFNRIDGSYINVTNGNPYPKGFLNEFRARTWNFYNFNRR